MNDLVNTSDPIDIVNLTDLNYEKYIMHPTLHTELSSVHGFTNLNGDNYMEHICIIFDKELTSDQKFKILRCSNSTQALKKLQSFGIKYTHNHSYN